MLTPMVISWPSSGNVARERVDDAVGDRFGSGETRVVVEQDRELVATEPGGDVP